MMRTIRMMFGIAATAGALAACTVPGSATPELTIAATPAAVTTVQAPPAQTVYVQAPVTHTVVVPAPAFTPAQDQWYAQSSWIDSQPPIAITPGPGQTDCQWLHANGYSYAQAFAAWAQNGYPANWSATNDGYPCQRSYGMQH